MRLRMRAGSLAVFWLLVAALPLLVSLPHADPLACCRGNGAHHCFMRPRASAPGPKLATPDEVCRAATAKATPHHAAIFLAPVVAALSVRWTRLEPLVVDVLFVRPRFTRGSRAPPAA